MAHGYNGQILMVDLTEAEVSIDTPEEAFYRTYMGGSAMGAYYVLKYTPKGADPYGKDNTLALMCSVVTGVPFSGQSRFTAVAKSPLTGLIGDSQAGGYWGLELKVAGFDGIVLTGKSEKPVYLWINNGQVELRDASHIWGRFTSDVEQIIRSEIGDERIQVLQCGPAGEQGVRFGALITNANRANGRTGMGTVMASKNLRAIAVRGNKPPSVAHPEIAKSLSRWAAQNFEESDVAGLGRLGTAMVVTSQDKAGGLPTYNWDSGTFEKANDLSGITMEKTILSGRDTCYACVVRCKREVKVTEGEYQVDPIYGGPEYETISTMGTYCGVSDLKAVSYANQLCNMYGMDTISCGATIAWAMDCFEHGLLALEDTDGVDLRYGNASAMVQMVEMIGKREGFGRILGEGSARAADILGLGHDRLMTIKKQELPAHMPQVKRSLGLIYLVNPFGPDHQSHEHDPAYAGYPERMAELGLMDPQPSTNLNSQKVRYALYTQQFYSCMDSLNVCQFAFGPAWQLYGPSDLVEAVKAATGWNVSLWELMKVGERRINLLQAFNVRERGEVQDELPDKLFKPLKGGASDGVSLNREEIEDAKFKYYGMAGWDAYGRPSRPLLEELALTWVADLLEN